MSRSFRRGLLALTLAGLSVRLLFVALEPPTGPVADETMWVSWGSEILPSPEVAFSPLALRLIFHPPLYPYFIGVVFTLFGSLTAVKVVQCLAAALLVPAVGLAGARAFSERSGLVAAALSAFYPDLVWFSAHFWAETLFTVLVWWGMERLLAADQRPSAWAAAVAGALFGLAVLTRETVLYFMPLAGFWLAWRRRGGARRGLLLVAASLLVVLPWTWRNWVAFEAFIPVSTAGALNLWQGNTRLSRQEVYEENWAVKGRVEKYRHAQRRALEAILERQPLWIFEKLHSEMPAFWEAYSQSLVHLERGAYGPFSRTKVLPVVVLFVGSYLAALALFVAGVAVVPRRRPAVLLLGFLAYYVLLHVASHGYPRYRLPAMPVLFLVGACGWALGRSPERPPLSRARKAATAAVALALALSVGPSLVTWLTEPWPPPSWTWTQEGGMQEGPP